jgi:hypothetical protein
MTLTLERVKIIQLRTLSGRVRVKKFAEVMITLIDDVCQVSKRSPKLHL